jgi:hypothetical protein
MKTRLLGLSLVVALAACTGSESDVTGGAGTGSTGAGGTTGVAGTTGSAGTTGVAGTTGSAGTTGVAGTTGAAGTGVAGTTGSAGTTGAAGTTGEAGTTGAAGTNANTAGMGGSYTGKPLGGTARALPGKIQIEDYDTGGEGVAYHDKQVVPHGQLCGVTRTDVIDLNCTGQAGSPADKNVVGCGTEPAGAVYLGYIDAGDWLRYTVTVAQAGTYVISGHEGIAGNNVSVSFTFTPTAALTPAVKVGPVKLPSTDKCGHEAYHVWGTHDNLAEITLPAGTYVMQLDIVSAAMNLDWFAFTKKP